MCVCVCVYSCTCVYVWINRKIVASVGPKQTNISNVIWFMYIFTYISDFSCLTKAVIKIIMSNFLCFKNSNQGSYLGPKLNFFLHKIF